MGIFFGIVFLAWFISGIAFMYWGMPSLSEAERLGHVAPLDLSTVQISPAEAADLHFGDPSQLRIEMYYDRRPVYRFGTTRVYADTGESVEGATAEEALDLVRKWVPEHASTVRYDAYLEDSDQWTLQTAQRYFMPVHRIGVGDAADTFFYVSERWGEPVMKTDRKSRFWGFWSGVLHWTYFTALRRNGALWIFLVTWGSMVGALMCLMGIVIGVWRLGLRRRYRLKGVSSVSPYAGWMWWHHYAGLVFGFLTCTWAFSGALSLTPFDSLRVAPMTSAQRMAVSGDPVDFELMTVDRLRASLAAFTPAFAPKEMEYLQFRGEPYFIGYRPPPEYDYAMEVGSNAERYTPPREHLIVSAVAPEHGTFKRFDDASMWRVVEEAMPGVPMRDATWLDEYDNYYYNQDGQEPLPVLRARYADERGTWLYLDPHRRSLTKHDKSSRLERWLYHGFHYLDLPFLYYKRPLWDIVVIGLSIGGMALAATTLLPMWRRLMRHARRGRRLIAGRFTRGGMDPTSGD